MRLGEKKIICVKNGRQLKKRLSVLIIVLMVVFLITYSGVLFYKKVRPAIIDNAKFKAHRIAQQAINTSIIKLFAEEGVSYSDVIDIKKGEDGKVIAAESNLEGINILKSKIIMETQNYISELDTAEIRLPLGALFGTDILAGVGPKVSFEFMPEGISEVDFVSEFEDCGINQTKLSIDLNVKTTVTLLMPGANTKIDVKTTVPVVRTIIVGDVPNSYTNVEREGEGYEDDVLQLSE